MAESQSISTAYEILASHGKSQNSDLSELLAQCLPTYHPPSYMPAWLRKQAVRGEIVRKFTENNGKLEHILINRGLESVDIDNPLHVLAGLHPHRHIRLAALKLARKLDINITDVCNFHCEYCYQRSRDEDWSRTALDAEQNQLSTESWHLLFLEAEALGVRKVKFTGGEPFTKPKFLDIFALAYNCENFSEIEIVTNLSLLRGSKLDRLKEIVRDGERLHFHVSIDGFTDVEEVIKKQDKIFSPSKFAHITKLLNQIFPKATLSINSMWTRKLVNDDSFLRIHEYLCKIRPQRWSLSLPYLVADVVDFVKSEPDFVPDFDTILTSASRLLEQHISLAEPFPVSIPLLYKHEAKDVGFSLSKFEDTDDVIDHPCFPCHGSYFIVGAYGNAFDCLLLGKTKVSYPSSSLTQLLSKVGEDNQWYSLTTKEVATDCQGCRYENICQGQCPNDRFNANGKRFGRDKSACSMLVRAEKSLWNRLGSEVVESMSQSIQMQGYFPATYQSFSDIINGCQPTTSDVYPDGKAVNANLPLYPVNVEFHRADK